MAQMWSRPSCGGSLPDNEMVLERLAMKFQISARNLFGLMSNVGEDCAGAVQFATSYALTGATRS
jgi:HipA-like protein